MFRDGLDWILGIRPVYDGLMVDPCIPHHWDGYKVVRKFRGAVYEIDVVNPEHIEHGTVEIEINGEKIEGNVLPIYPAGARVMVTATMCR